MAFIVIIILSLSLLTACQIESERSIELEFWAMGQEGEWVQAFLPEFQRLNPGIKVKVQQIPWNSAHEKLLTAYAGDAMPDLFQLGNTWIPEMAALKAIEPLNDWALNLSLDDFFSGIIATNRLEDKLFAIPWYVDTRVIFYRKDILAEAGFDSPPKNWQDWRYAMELIQKNHAYAFFLPVNDWRLPVILSLQNKASLLKDNDRYGDFHQDSFQQAFEFYISFFNKGLAPKLAESEMTNLYQEFSEGYFSIFVSGPWNLAEMRHRLPKDKRWATEALPGSSLAQGASLAISRRAKHKKEAWKLIEYLTEVQQQIAFYKLSGDLPSRRSAWLDADLKQDEALKAFQTQLEFLVSTPKIPEWEHIANQLSQTIEKVVRGEMSQDEALIELNQKVDAILEKRRWLMDRSVKQRV